jgi:hypothetical protein
VRRYLVVANQTLGGEHLRRKISELLEAGPAEFHILVPASHPSGKWTEGQVTKLAQERLDEALAGFREMGAQVSGEVGDASPVRAIADVLISDPELYDEIILSTLPIGPSRWLRQDVPHRVRKTFAVPCTHLVADTEPAGIGDS